MLHNMQKDSLRLTPSCAKGSQRMDVNKPVTNPGLIKAIKLMKQNSKMESEFLIELFKATFLCPGRIDKANVAERFDSNFTLGEGTKLTLSSLDSVSGEEYLMAFTDWNELRKWQNVDGQQTFLFSIIDYKTIVLGNLRFAGVVINPFSENVVLDREKLGIAHSNENIIEKDESVMIGEPSNYPKRMIDELVSYFQATEFVDEAFLLWMARGDETSYLLVLDSTHKPQDLYPAIGKICKPFIVGQLLDMVSLNSEFGKKAVKNRRPFYRRQVLRS